MATILDVAKEANVSTATVSRVLNDSYLVTNDKKRRVMQAIEKVGYKIPERIKINQNQNNTNSIILIVACNLLENIILNFQKEVSELGYQTIIFYYFHCSELDALEKTIENIENNLAGILLLNTIDKSQKFQDIIGKYPLVQIGEPIMENKSNNVVYVDEIKLAQDATDYMINYGCKKIAIVCSEPSEIVLFSKKKRQLGYYLSLIEHGIAIDESMVITTDITIDGAYEATKKLLENNPDVDGILCICSILAEGALYALNAKETKNNDILLFSLDKSEIWDFFPLNKIAYMDTHSEELAVNAAKMLESVINDCSNSKINSDYKVVIKHTLGN